MAESQCNGKDRILVAIDVAKHEHVVLIEYPDGRQEKLRVMNRREELQSFSSLLKGPNLPVVIGLEPTCSYHRNIAYFLKTEGFEVQGINTFAMAKTREAFFNSWDKNDPKDAKVILYMIRNGITQSLSEPALEGHNHLQELSKTHFQIVQRKTKLQHSILNHYLPIYFPEAHVFFRGSRVRWFSRVLKHFPTPSTVRHYKSLDDFIKVADPIIGRVPFKHSVLKDFYDLAQISIGIPVKMSSYEVQMFRYTVEEHDRLNQHLANLEQQIEELLGDNGDYKLLKSVPGIGPLIALTVLAEAGDLRRFKYVEQVLKYCGLNLSTEQSGQSRGNSKLSKKGNARLRCVFWQAARCAIESVKYENSLKQKYLRYIARAPKNTDLRRKARTACTAKMARIVFSLIHKGERYRSDPKGARPDQAERLVENAVEALTS